jgi:4'-phosphopantetheinyl transferase
MQPAPPRSEVHVWRADFGGGEGAIRAASRRALQVVLGRYLELPATEVELKPDAHGKPRVAAAQALEFNLSHSGELALIAVGGDVAVGVDVEREKPGRDVLALAARILAPQQVEAVRRAAPKRRDAVFYAAWVRHEARLKCGGGGFGGPAPAGPISVTDVAVGPGYAAAVALAGETAPQARLYRLDLR